MWRFASSWSRLVWPVLLLLIGGCTMKPVHIQLVTFRNGEIDGVWLWRQQSDGKYTRTCRFSISNPHLQSGIEVVSYGQSCIGSQPTGFTMQAEVERVAGDPNAATLRLHYQRGSGPLATYRASAENSSGESALSSTTVVL